MVVNTADVPVLNAEQSPDVKGYWVCEKCNAVCNSQPGAEQCCTGIKKLTKVKLKIKASKEKKE